MQTISINTAAQMRKLGAKIARQFFSAHAPAYSCQSRGGQDPSIIQQKSNLKNGYLIYLHGNLGAGKTTFVRGFLRQLGFKHSVKSPTFTLVECYELAPLTIYHFDLYRLENSEELEYIGIRDYFKANTIVLIEWPERAAQLLPKPDLTINIEFVPDFPQQRQITLSTPPILT